MSNRILKILGVLSAGVVSSLIAWGFTVNWGAAALAFVGVIILIVTFLKVRSMATLLTLRINDSGIQAIYRNQYAAERFIKGNLLSEAKEVDVLAIRGFGIFGLKDSLLRRHIVERNHSLRVRILLLNPASDKCAKRASEINEAEEYFAGTIKTAIGAVIELKRLQVTNLEARLYTDLPVWRIIRIDDCIFVSSFLPANEGHLSPMYRIHRNAAMSLFPSFKRYFDDVWEKSRNEVI